MAEQDVNIEPGAKGRLRYDKERKAIVGDRDGDSRTVRDPFLNKDVQISNKLTDRLRGRYANGPTMPNGEPEFGWREFSAPPIQQEAAAEIDRLAEQIARLKDLLMRAGPAVERACVAWKQAAQSGCAGEAFCTTFKNRCHTPPEQ